MSEKINEEEIRFLSPRDACRRRTGMYLGSTENANITIREIIDNSCDEISSGYGDTILISNNFNGYCFVADNGRGLPISMSIDKPDITAAELSITEFHSGSKFDGTDTIARVGMNGIGSSAVNFTSSVYIILSKITENNYNRSIPAVNQAWSESGPRVRKELYYILVMNEGLKVYEGAGRLGDLEKEIFKDVPGYISLPEGQSTIVLFKPDPTIFENINVEIPLSNLQYFLLIQEKFYKKRVNVIVNGENIRSSFKPYQFEITETIIPKDTTYNKQVGIYITFEADPTLGNVVSAGSVNGLTCDDGCHMSLVKNLYKSALKDYFKVKHDYLLNGFKFVCIVLANECQFNSQTKENLKQITKVKTTDFDDVVKDFQKIFKKNEDYWTEHVGKLNYLAESMKSLSAIDKAQKIIDDAGGRGIYKLKGEIANGFADATASDRWNCNLFLCFSGDTEILTCNDERISFVDLVNRLEKGENIYTFSCKSTGEIIPAKILTAKKVKKTNKLCKLVLDNGEEIKCTPDHEMMLRDGSYCSAENLKPGDSLMPCYITKSDNYDNDERRVICDMRDSYVDCKCYRNDEISKSYNGRLIPIYHIMSEHSDTKVDESTKDCQIINRHHIDNDKFNDSPLNLLKCSISKHKALHAKDHSRKAHDMAKNDVDIYNKMYVLNKQSDEYREKTSKRFKEFYKSDKGAVVKKILKECAVEQWKDENLRKWRSEKTREFAKTHPEWAKKNSQLAKISWWKNKILPEVDKLVSLFNLEKTSKSFNKAIIELRKKNLRVADFDTMFKYDSSLVKDYVKVTDDEISYINIEEILKSLLEKKLSVNIENFNNEAKVRYEVTSITGGRGYTSSKKKYPDLFKKYEALLNNNHKILSVEVIELDNPEDVYCLEVDTPEHNFPLAAGIFTKNCEGLSAAGSLKKGRKDTRYNAVMPLRGKVKNVKDSSADQAMDNKELFTIFKLIGLGIDVNNVTKDAKTPEEAYELIKRYTRFSKIVIATDADED